MRIRRVGVLALAVLVVGGACGEGLDPEQLRYTIVIENDTPENLAEYLTVALVTPDGRETFESIPTRVDQRETYLGGHFTVSIRPYVESLVSQWKLQRDQLEEELLTSDDASKAASLEEAINALNLEIQTANARVVNSVSCTNGYPENREADVRIGSVFGSLHIDCGVPTE